MAEPVNLEEVIDSMTEVLEKTFLYKQRYFYFFEQQDIGPLEQFRAVVKDESLWESLREYMGDDEAELLTSLKESEEVFSRYISRFPDSPSRSRSDHIKICILQEQIDSIRSFWPEDVAIIPAYKEILLYSIN